MVKSFFKIVLFLAGACPAVCSAQTYQATMLGAKAVIKDQAIEIQFYSPDIVRITKTPSGQTFRQASLSVIKKTGQTPLKLSKRGEALDITSSKVKVTLDLKTGAISYANIKGTSLLKEKADGATFKPFDDAGSKTLTVAQSFVLDKDEAVYGLGQHQRGNLNQRNQVYRT